MALVPENDGATRWTGAERDAWSAGLGCPKPPLHPKASAPQAANAPAAAAPLTQRLLPHDNAAIALAADLGQCRKVVGERLVEGDSGLTFKVGLAPRLRVD